jgi:hypothetical protein
VADLPAVADHHLGFELRIFWSDVEALAPLRAIARSIGFRAM